MSKKIILAGGSGFLGSALVEYFSALKWEVVVLTRQPKAQTDGARRVGGPGLQRVGPVPSPGGRTRLPPPTSILPFNLKKAVGELAECGK